MSNDHSENTMMVHVAIQSEGEKELEFDVPLTFGRKWFRISFEYKGMPQKFAFSVLKINRFLWYISSFAIALNSILFRHIIPITEREMAISEDETKLVVDPRWPGDTVFIFDFPSHADFSHFFRTLRS